MGEAISSEMGMEQTPGSGGTCTLTPEACSPRAGSGSSFPAPLLRPGAVPGDVTCLLPGSPRHEEALTGTWPGTTTHPLLGAEGGDQPGFQVSSLYPL